LSLIDSTLRFILSRPEQNFQSPERTLRFTILYDNYLHREETRTGQSHSGIVSVVFVFIKKAGIIKFLLSQDIAKEEKTHMGEFQALLCQT